MMLPDLGFFLLLGGILTVGPWVSKLLLADVLVLAVDLGAVRVFWGLNVDGAACLRGLEAVSDTVACSSSRRRGLVVS